MEAKKLLLLADNPALKFLLLEDKKSQWVNPLFSDREQAGEFHTLYKELLKQPVKFYEYTRMYPDTFFYILGAIKNDIEKRSNFRKCISAEERLLITLRFLSTGLAYRSLAFSYRIAHNTICGIIYETCEAIWKNLRGIHLPHPTKEMFLSVAKDFHSIWNFPNCVGCIDGKHIRMKCPRNSGSVYFNYKQYFSINLQAVVDAKYKFICVDIGGYGRNSDSGVFLGSDLHKYLEEEKLNIPVAQEIQQTNLCVPFVLLGDLGYPLKSYLMRPYNSHDSDNEKEIFNYRLRRARRVVECAFGMLVAKWRCLNTELQLEPPHVDVVVKCVCVLHNIIIDKEGVEENFLKNMEEGFKGNVPPIRNHNRSAREAYAIRDKFKDYFNGAGAVQFQFNRS